MCDFCRNSKLYFVYSIDQDFGMGIGMIVKRLNKEEQQQLSTRTYRKRILVHEFNYFKKCVRKKGLILCFCKTMMNKSHAFFMVNYRDHLGN